MSPVSVSRDTRKNNATGIQYATTVMKKDTSIKNVWQPQHNSTVNNVANRDIAHIYIEGRKKNLKREQANA